MDDNTNMNLEQQEGVPMTAQDDTATEEESGVSTGVLSPENDTETPVAAKPKFQKKWIAILGVIVVVVIAVAFAFLHESKFEKVRNKCDDMAIKVSSGDNYFTIDTYPDEFETMDEALADLILPRTQEIALEAIQYANEELGFNGSLYSQMLKTTALMGRQREENDKYKVSWTYQPDEGLEVTYEKK